MLGLYDSGLGGLTVLAALRQAGIDQDVLYFADQAHVPYGDRTDADLSSLLAENFALLDAQGVDAMIMACNTSCAVAARSGGFPPAHFPVLDLIENAAAAFRETRLRRIAVIATAATVRASAYSRAIARYAPHIEVFEIAAPALVPLVEQGEAQSAAARAAVDALCAQLPRDLDAIVYGCTHYPFLDAAFAATLAPHVARLDPAHAQARAALALVRSRSSMPGTNATHYLTNGNVAAFRANIARLTAQTPATITQLPPIAACRHTA